MELASAAASKAKSPQEPAVARQPAPNMIDLEIMEKLNLENQAMRQQLLNQSGSSSKVADDQQGTNNTLTYKHTTRARAQVCMYVHKFCTNAHSAVSRIQGPYQRL